MALASRSAQQVVLAILIGIILGCSLGSVVIAVMVVPPIVRAALAPTATPSPTATRFTLATITLAPPPSRTPTFVPATLEPTSTPGPTRTIGPTRTVRPVPQHFLVVRPVNMNAASVTPALTYLYGTTGRGDYDVHHGEEFVNPTGTPLFAVADGTVVTAGNDSRRICGDDGKKVCGRDVNFYGNVVVIRLDQDYNGQPVFALYGHMNRIGVAEGDRVKQGDAIGEIGMTGIAIGPHVHFEIRIGVNDYAHTRNPILWMKPLAGRGAIAGRFTDAKGNPVRGAVINLFKTDPETFFYSTETYGRDDAPPVNSDEELGENFAMPDLAPGEYIVRVSNQQYAARVTVQEGRVAYVELGGLP